MSSAPESIGIIGGTGPEGRGLGLRFAAAGHQVLLGSRSRERAAATARELSGRVEGHRIEGRSNAQAAADADILIVTLPFPALSDTLPELAEAAKGKLVISAVVPLAFPEGRPVMLPVPAGSAAQEVQNLLPLAIVAAAFQSLDSALLQDLGRSLDSDVIVTSDVADARHTVMSLAGELPGVRPLSAGRLAASRFVEDVTGLLVTVNRIYKAHSGITITGLNR
ncbi:MAG: NADPH-dependent F420 reductase [Chloroflexota bacterium]